MRLHTGEVVLRQLAERGCRLRNGLWVRDVRTRDEDGAQGSILSTNRRLDLRPMAALMPARWSQENLLKYMRQHFGLDRLIEYGTRPLLKATVEMNPA
jgi:hypothetical protein